MTRSKCVYWAITTCLLSACGSRLAATAETNGECHGDCAMTDATSECGEGGCSDSAGASDSSTNEPDAVTSNGATATNSGSFANLPPDHTTHDDSETATGGCRVAYAEYPVGAKVPADGCDDATCTCDAAGDLVDCTEPSSSCVFDGNGPIRNCDDVFPEGVPRDALLDGDGYVLGSTLFLGVSHAGGCARHDYALCFRPLPESEQGYEVDLIHDAHGDHCEAAIQTTLQFDLTPMARFAMDRLGTSDGIIHTQYGVYTFGELTCAHRDQAARIAVTDLLNQVDRSCSHDEDCVSTLFTEECTEECNAVSRADQVYRFDRLRDSLQAGACDGFLEQGCDPNFPLCERRMAVCLDGKCELSLQ